VEKWITPAQVAQAQKLAREWMRVWVSLDWSEEELDQLRAKIGDQLARDPNEMGRLFLYFPRK